MYESSKFNLTTDLPQDVREAANLRDRDRVVVWTKLDPQLEDRVGGQACLTTFGPLLFLPCFWPHMLVCLPCLCVGRVSAANAMRSQYWILTERELKVITLDYQVCCVATSGTKVKSIPLENITDCGVDAVGKGCLNDCFDPLPSMYVDTASSGAGSREAVGVALAEYRTFIQKILDQRDIVKGTVASGAVVVAEPMQRGGDTAKGSAADRMNQAKELYDGGLISESEYEKKRKDILAGV